jgi:hypothetical protein
VRYDIYIYIYVFRWQRVILLSRAEKSKAKQSRERTCDVLFYHPCFSDRVPKSKKKANIQYLLL